MGGGGRRVDCRDSRDVEGGRVGLAGGEEGKGKGWRSTARTKEYEEQRLKLSRHTMPEESKNLKITTKTQRQEDKTRQEKRRQ